MPTYPNMGLILPEVSVTLGPIWAQMLNTAANVTDNHDHSPGKGVKIKPSGLNINSDLTFGGNNATNMNSIEFLTTLTGTLTSISSIYSFGGDLWYNNGGGTPVQITSGASVVAPIGGSLNEYEYTAIAANTVILPADTFCYINVDTTSSVQITLPLASSVANGRFYIVKDFNGLSGTNNISIVPSGADLIDGLNTQIAIDSAYSEITLVGDGISSWSLVSKKNTPRATLNNRVPRFDGLNGYMKTSTATIADDGTLDATNVQAANLLLGSATNSVTANAFWETYTRSTGTTVGVRGVAISAESGSVSETTTTPQDIGITATITTTGRPTFFFLTSDSSSGIIQVFADSSGNIFQGRVSIRRNGTIVASHEISCTLPTTALGGIAVPPGSINGVSTQSAGTYSFDVTIASLNSDSTINVDNIKLVVFEL